MILKLKLHRLIELKVGGEKNKIGDRPEKHWCFHRPSTKPRALRKEIFDSSAFACFSIPLKIFKNSGVANFCCASSLLSRILSNAFEIHSTVSLSFASGMMKEKASSTGSELRNLLDEGLTARMLLMEFAIQRASSDVFDR